jgi:hypothetical protein
MKVQKSNESLLEPRKFQCKAAFDELHLCAFIGSKISHCATHICALCNTKEKLLRRLCVKVDFL